MKLILASDHAGYNLKNELLKYLKKNYADIYEIIDLGCECSNISVDYPSYAKKVADFVSTSKNTYGVLVCGTGIGMCIAANKVKGIRASNICNSYSARMSKTHNNSNILCLGARVTGIDLAIDILCTWLSFSYEGGRHQERLNIIKNIEEGGI